ncbi:CGNR zinc finger domain-containing protein [Myxococcaceae bacterium GXIMD 01537]
MGWPPRFLFISGRLAIDFVHTGGEGMRSHWERWHTPKDLAEWMLECPLLQVRAKVDSEVLQEARELREAIWEASQVALRQEPLPAASIRVIQRAAARPDLVPVLRQGERAWRPGSTGSEALSTIARDAIELFGTGARARLRKCQNPTCFLMFLDLSRPGKRAWCTMRRCGNLNKLARYRGNPRGMSAPSSPSRKDSSDGTR